MAAHAISTGSDPTIIGGTATVAVLLLAASVRHLLHTESPLLDLRTLKVRTFRISQSAGFLYFVVAGGTPFLLSLLYQERFGWSAVKSSTMILLIFAGNLLVKPATTVLLQRWGFRRILVVSGIGLAILTASIGVITPKASTLVVGVVMLLCGVFRSVGLTAYTTIALSDVAPLQMRDANVLAVTTQQLAAGLAIALATALLRAGQFLGRDLPAAVVPAGAFTVVFVLFALVALCATVVSSRLPATAGDALRSRQSCSADA